MTGIANPRRIRFALSGPEDVEQYPSDVVPTWPEGGTDEPTTAEHVEDTAREADDEEEGDPRGEAACTECAEGVMVPTERRHPAATQAVCDVCGHSE
jgi:hypothetical protein